MPSPDVEHRPALNREESDAVYWEEASGNIRVATLGDEPTGSTCSIDAARDRFAPSLGLLAGFGTFEECAEAVARGSFDIAVVPAAYPDIHQLFFDRRLHASETFLHRLPDMVAASRHETYPVTVSRVYHHPATISLVTAMKPHAESCPATSNTRACADLIADTAESGTAVTVTNRLAADAYGLHRAPSAGPRRDDGVRRVRTDRPMTPPLLMPEKRDAVRSRVTTPADRSGGQTDGLSL